MLPDPKIGCPATGFARSCREILAERDCPKFVHVTGVNPQSEQPVDRFGCIDAIYPMLLIENSALLNQVIKNVQQWRNDLADIAAEDRSANKSMADAVAGFKRSNDRLMSAIEASQAGRQMLTEPAGAETSTR